MSGWQRSDWLPVPAVYTKRLTLPNAIPWVEAPCRRCDLHSFAGMAASSTRDRTAFTA